MTHPLRTTTTTTTTTTSTTVRINNGKSYKIVKHASIGALTLTLSRVLWHLPLTTQKTLIAISDPALEEEEEIVDFKAKALQFYEKPLLTRQILYQLGHIVATTILNRQKWLPMYNFKPLEQAVISASTFPLYCILINQESKLVARRGRILNPFHLTESEKNGNYWRGFGLHVLNAFFTHLIAIKVQQYCFGTSSLVNLDDQGVDNHDNSDARAVAAVHETVGMLFARLICLPMEIFSKQLILNSKPKRADYVSILMKEAILTVPQVASTLIEYWTYRFMNRLC